MSYFRFLRAKNQVTVPTFWQDQSYFLTHGFMMGFSLEITFLYFNAYDSFIRKACLKQLERARYADYKKKERSKLDVIKQEKVEKLR
mmetsp:Transcript_25227/g.31593  ORF Transcript_25227/g.31593 Transcript_25227/m.31593 type:complete len:87 (+) Transcript_25227:23-283(+)|eukprot:CAMPEP_0170469232 /NCGR_PEP_ID=MMETSP0123-20130129/12133_1 /TAXON_ID=182087 /ORGANISM="Favella ehrenbergii, Strain Fehren 1" /LENGTH=86 /DNA_ID=CAMNT_0010736037 /DNA_START=9 /DNA_END=269 /DNA_ORIENTATION=-